MPLQLLGDHSGIGAQPPGSLQLTVVLSSRTGGAQPAAVGQLSTTAAPNLNHRNCQVKSRNVAPPPTAAAVIRATPYPRGGSSGNIRRSSCSGRIRDTVCPSQ